MPGIQSVKISSLTLLENNPRTISKDQMQRLCKSIEEDPVFLNSRPILVHEKDNQLLVYAGNQRVRAAKRLKWKEIPCIIEKDLDEQTIKSRIIKDNKTYGVFDFDILANEYEIELLMDAGFLENEILGIFDEKEEIESEEKEQKKKKNMCPSCGHEF